MGFLTEDEERDFRIFCLKWLRFYILDDQGLRDDWALAYPNRIIEFSVTLDSPFSLVSS